MLVGFSLAIFWNVGGLGSERWIICARICVGVG